MPGLPGGRRKSRERAAGGRQLREHRLERDSGREGCRAGTGDAADGASLEHRCASGQPPAPKPQDPW